MCLAGADHYVFPEDCAQDDSDVVRTVEEENLFTLAFPDIVQLFHKETAEAKDNKLKSMSLFVLLLQSHHITDSTALSCFRENTHTHVSHCEACQADERKIWHLINNACQHLINMFLLIILARIIGSDPKRID